MADTATSKGLILLDPNLAYDVTKFNTNFQKTNDIVGTIICTSGTRPSTGLFDGMTIYETDTKLTYYRSSGAWVTNTIPPMEAVASLAARNALTGLWPGRQVWRTDMGWVETYDGTAWRVPSGTAVNALADVTNPLTGQLFVDKSTWVENRWSGAGWQRIRLSIPAPYVERRHAAASQATGAGAAYKVLFDTQINSPVDVTYAAGDFTFARQGIYNFTASIRVSAPSELYMWFARSASNNDNRAKDSKPGGTGSNKGISGEIRVAAGEAWALYVWSGVSVNIVKESANANDYPPYITARYQGEL